ncbi:MAG TPA: hypothetical protein VJW20_02975 [Candidatus Angelobacter sp.]|nr:hypothetical protein [Candidatus Angelobacter sp.]
MKRSSLLIANAAMVLLFALGAFADDTKGNTARPLAVNQTEGFADGQLLVFTYFQNFDCIHQPFDDLDHNGLVAAVDANEFQRPICTVGRGPTLDPAGRPIQNTLKLYVIAPFFGDDKDPNDAFTPELGQALLGLFGFIPEAFKTHPTVPVQCPEPGPPVTQHTGMPSTCTMHTTLTDLGPALAKLGKVPPNTSVIVPTLNHSHIIDGTDFGPVWWQVISVLVTDPSAWPSADGKSGINSLDALRAAQAAGRAAPDQPTNFFLFFGSQPEGQHH